MDMRTRTTRARHDTAHYRSLITQARGLIYAQNYTVNSKLVDDILRDESLVPTKVCLYS